MRRRLVTTAALVGVALVCGLPLLRVAYGAPAAPKTVRLVAPGGKPLEGRWQPWVNASRMPTVSGRVTVTMSGCPGRPKVAGCVYSQRSRVIYLRRGIAHARAVLLHELGHVYDLNVLSQRDRKRFRDIMRRPGRSWWDGKVPLAEWFAEAYSWCSRYKRIVSVDRYAIYSYSPTPSQHRRVCALIKASARDRTPPAAPPSVPVVTGDPPPPAVPPPGPGVVPGDPVRDPVPLPSSLPAPRPTPVATATPVPSPVATATAEPTPTATPRFPRRTPTPEPTPTPPR